MIIDEDSHMYDLEDEELADIHNTAQKDKRLLLRKRSENNKIECELKGRLNCLKLQHQKSEARITQLGKLKTVVSDNKA